MLKEGKHARRRLGRGRRDGHHGCQDSRSTLRRCEEDVLVRSTSWRVDFIYARSRAIERVLDRRVDLDIPVGR
jgi:hypothetical protein